jgi:hypothetical protein
MKNNSVIETLNSFDQEFSIEEFIQKLLFVEEIQMGLKRVQDGKVLDYQIAKIAKP